MVQTAEPLSLVQSLAQGERLREPAATQPLRLQSAASSRVPMLLHRRTKIADLMAQIEAHWGLSTPLAFD